MNRVRQVVGAIGRVLIGAGLLLLLFVAYQLWGTGIQEARAQHDLRRDFLATTTTTTTASTLPPVPGEPITTTSTLPDVPPPPPEGRAVAMIRIPRIGVEKAVVEGVGVPELKKGPGHYPGTPLPGQPGNSAIAGHRTTYGAPFSKLDELEEGDRILLTTAQGQFRFVVDSKRIVRPNQTEVLKQTTEARITLTTCHPRFSARQRLVVTAHLARGDEPAPTTTTSTTSTTVGTGSTVPTTLVPTTVPPLFEEQSLSGDRAAAGPTALWGIVSALVALAVWLLARKWRKWPAYLLGAPVFLVVLFLFYENVARLLPANI